MATATKKARTTRLLRSVEDRASDRSMEFLVFQDNGGRYCWSIVSASGELLAQSPSFASYEDARDAAGRMRDAAGSARLEPLGTVAADDDPDIERWSDEGGSYTAAVAVELPVPR